ncbi:MAG: transporter substrate-binding domain-containing protein [Cypionkella sp.]|uniref:transporter substrate-binding domain-containing protein n=1 Tax=Cypionkella sp. TaxID=2811411 RepID=UPI002ABA221B|nr:transporter substrate-binding domain-containing protein [Cypionkella sp.]MDZ4311344.1 transporter substrate-binding domain-containing protein [Cypionkella sp.]MDZ4393772.1 transporter substrate-binding domain-containing protein [Cypionkella sp.]
MKKIVIAATVSMLFGTVAFAEPLKIGVAAEPYPPFTSPDASGNWVGWEIDFLGAVCKKAALECVITPTAWDGIIPALTAGQIDVIMSSMSINEEREKSIDFTDKYYNTPTAVMATKGSGVLPTAEGLNGKIIGVQVSTIQEAYVQAHFPESELKSYQTSDESYQDLAAGRIDAVVADSIVVADFLKTEAGACCENVGDVVDDPVILGRGVGFGLRKGDALKETLNAAIAAVRADGEYDAITKKYFTIDIYGPAN